MHACADMCRAWEGMDLGGRRFAAALSARPSSHFRVLPLVRHRCGPRCLPRDDGGPVRLGRAGEPVSYDLGLSPAAAGLLARLRR